MTEENQIKTMDNLLNCKRVLSELYEDLMNMKTNDLSYHELLYMIDKCIDNINVNYINKK